MSTLSLPAIRATQPAWNKGRIVGQKRPHFPKTVWATRVRLEIAVKHGDLALFNLVKLKVAYVFISEQVKERTSITQSKTQKPVRFEIIDGIR